MNLDEMVGFNITLTSKRIVHRLNQLLADYEITAEQWSVLKKVDDNTSMNQKQLAILVEKDQPTLTKILDLLVKRKLINRIPNKNDRRSFCVVMTDKGHELRKQVAPVVEQWFQNIVNDIPVEKLQIYIEVTKRLKRTLDNMPLKAEEGIL